MYDLQALAIQNVAYNTSINGDATRPRSDKLRLHSLALAGTEQDLHHRLFAQAISGRESRRLYFVSSLLLSCHMLL